MPLSNLNRELLTSLTPNKVYRSWTLEQRILLEHFEMGRRIDMVRKCSRPTSPGRLGNFRLSKADAYSAMIYHRTRQTIFTHLFSNVYTFKKVL